MNDFTKEELNLLAGSCFLSWVNSLSDPVLTVTVRDDYKNLQNKIQSMIDNYCEHEPEMDIGKDSRPRYLKAIIPICRKCGKNYTYD